jgi:hypothetical protein
MIQSSQNGSLLTLPKGYYLYFVYDEGDTPDNSQLLHCGIYEDNTQALIGLNTQYQPIEPEFTDMLQSLFTSDEEINRDQLYPLLIQQFKRKYANDEQPVYTHYFKLPLGDYSLDTIVHEAPEIELDFSDDTSDNTNHVLLKYIDSLNISNPGLQSQIITTPNESEIYVPPGYHLYFIYDKNTNRLLYTNIHDTAVNAILGMYKQYAIINEEYATYLMIPLLETQPADATTAPEHFFNFLAQTMASNYANGKSSFYLKWFSLPVNNYEARTKIENIIPTYQILNTKTLSGRKLFTQQQISRYMQQQPHLSHQQAFQLATEDWKHHKQ